MGGQASLREDDDANPDDALRKLQRERARWQQVLLRVRHGTATCLRGLWACQPATSQVLFGMRDEYQPRNGAGNQAHDISASIGSRTGCLGRASAGHDYLLRHGGVERTIDAA